MKDTNRYKPVTASILLVSANENSLEKIGNKFLKRYCNCIYTANSLKKARDIFTQNDIDIVLCDTNQDDGYYFNFLQEFKSIKKEYINILLCDKKDTQIEQNSKLLKSFFTFSRPIKSSRFLEKIFEADKQVAANKKYLMLQKEQFLNEIFESQGENVKKHLQKCENPAVYLDDETKIQQYNEAFEQLFAKDTILKQRSLHELLIQSSGKGFEKDFLEQNDNFSAATTFEPNITYNLKVKDLEFGFNKRYIVEFDIKCSIETKVIKPKILLIEDSPVARKIVRRELNPQANKMELVEAQSAEEALEILQTYMPCIIICDLVLPKMSGLQLIEKLKQTPLLCDIPIIVLSELENMRVNKTLVDLGVTSFMQKPFKPTKLQKRIAMIRKQSKPCLDVQTKKVVHNLCKFSSSMHNWQILKNTAAALLHHFDSTESEVAYGNYSLGLLAASHFDTNCFTRATHLAQSFELSTQFLSFLESLKNPISTVEQIFAIIWKEFLEAKGIDTDNIVINNSAVKTKLEEFLANNRVLLQDGEGVRETVKEYNSILSQSSIDNYLKSEFIKVIEKVLLHQLIYAGGGSCELRCHEQSVNFVFIPRNEDMNNMDALMKHLESAAKNFNLTFEEIENTTSLSITSVETQPQVETIAEQESDFMDFSFDEQTPPTQSQEEQTPKIDAVTFINDNDIDMEDIESLEYLETDLFEAIAEFSFYKDQNEKLAEIGELFRKYGTTIIYLREFNTISQALTNLATQFISTDIEKIDPALAKMLPNILENLVTDLQSWRESIFVYNKAEDVHFLDSSITNNCSQCITFLTPKEAKEENEADIFF